MEWKYMHPVIRFEFGDEFSPEFRFKTHWDSVPEQFRDKPYYWDWGPAPERELWLVAKVSDGWDVFELDPFHRAPPITVSE